MSTALVVPTVRPDLCKEFLDAWAPVRDWDATYIIEDNPHQSFHHSGIDFHGDWTSLEADLGGKHTIVSRRNAAVRLYGWWKAYHDGHDIIATLDDDCFPSTPGFMASHGINLDAHDTRWRTSCGDRSRGLPYFDQGRVPVGVNHGLWRGIPDLDAVQQLSGAEITVESQGIIPRGYYMPFCGMNFAWKRELTPCIYFPLQGKGQPYDRLDDIWGGLIIKKLCDHLGYAVSSGYPFIEHRRASDPITNLQKEAPGWRANETMWKIIDRCEVTHLDPKLAAIELGAAIREEAVTIEDETLCEYTKIMGTSLQVWAGLF